MMFDDRPAPSLTLSHARVVTPAGIVEGGLRIEAGRIAGTTHAADGIDLGGAFLIPGFVDLHTDHAERHVHPRANVLWPLLPALLAHDAVVISGGTTTVLDSLSVGASMKRPERREILEPLVAALDAGCRAGAVPRRPPPAPALRDLRPRDHGAGRCHDGPPAHAARLDHGPHPRRPAEPGRERWFAHMIHEMEVDEATGRAMMDDLLERSRTARCRGARPRSRRRRRRRRAHR
jgi:alpha-D-ribose 1-methylphosphonate 5-triphosphate diphosphatase